MDATPALGIVREYADLLAVARAQMARLSITFETLDVVSGVQSGYSAKLLGPRPSRRFGRMSLPAIMGALGIALVAIEDADALARVRKRLVKRKMPPVRNHWRRRTRAAA